MILPPEWITPVPPSATLKLFPTCKVPPDCTTPVDPFATDALVRVSVPPARFAPIPPLLLTFNVVIVVVPSD